MAQTSKEATTETIGEDEGEPKRDSKDRKVEGVPPSECDERAKEMDDSCWGQLWSRARERLLWPNPTYSDGGDEDGRSGIAAECHSLFRAGSGTKRIPRSELMSILDLALGRIPMSLTLQEMA
eukprot:CAMPEP_0194769672 /NCGR_PEP_ID=MMETSP0323_2-20130528/43876_1 /TAXON_ID=2866 ORGANISM="Crypthecodinium cohnii, Strain Seligo" /NCGR_SAMPLE_ID=MMETSP0323_2 /ASSEMBLY_ACC=CAM_ASM_000346 /LENGTH=122 /DNA_ID=CAMNT_0039702783 /DNA_START=86 /DNA_END=455 /DNA_ORIENTATION=+